MTKVLLTKGTFVLTLLLICSSPNGVFSQSGDNISGSGIETEDSSKLHSLLEFTLELTAFFLSPML